MEDDSIFHNSPFDKLGNTFSTIKGKRCWDIFFNSIVANVDITANNTTNKFDCRFSKYVLLDIMNNPYN